MKFHRLLSVTLYAQVLCVAPAAALPHDASTTSGSAHCPSVLMFDGVSLAKDVNEAKAQYWGQYAGIDGFFLNDVMSSWQDTVADDENSQDYQRLKRFEDLYSRYGINQNFIKVAIYKPVDWRNSAEQARDVQNFRRAAHLARLAGMRGIALDLEPYVKGFWDADASNPAKGDTLYDTGKAIGDAISQAYPGSPVFIIGDALWWQNRSSNYALSGRFWDGLIASSVPLLYIGTELTYNGAGIPDELRLLYRDDALRNRVDPTKVEIETASWPLGRSYVDKSNRMPPEAFSRQLKNAFDQHSRYFWIYGFGSAWETDGPYGKGAVAPNFREYVAALRQVKKTCADHYEH